MSFKDWFGGEGKPAAKKTAAKAAVHKPSPARKGRHDHGKGINPVMGSTYKPRHSKKS